MKGILPFLFLVVVFAYTYGQQDLSLQPHIHIENGMIRGTIGFSVKGRPFNAFKGIRYAKPPVGKHRFKDPQPVKFWRGVWDASEYGSECLQFDFITEKVRVRGDEDCLFVNVFTPKAPSGGFGPLMNVIVFIHGGGFMYGSSFQYGPEILMDRDVVVVTFNYRLGPLGFLSTEDDVVPGNMGLKDQALALKWIQQNIAAFGGNPNSVTITGCSAGGASVHYHYLSSLSRGLFHRGISLSGSALLPWAQQEAAREKAQQIGAELGCPTFSSRELIECLRRRPARRIVQLVDKFQVWFNNPFSPFAPVVERGGLNPFLTEHPADALRFGRVQNVPWIASVTTAEGNYPMAAVVTNPKLMTELDTNWHRLAPHILDFNYTVPQSQHAAVAEKAKNIYLRDEKSFGEKRGQGLIQMVGDRIFVVDLVRSARLQASVSSAPVYFYRFSYRGRHSLSEDFSGKDIDLGVAHGDDLSYTIKTLYMDSGETPQDKEMREVMLDFWTHFAATGKCNFRDIHFEGVNPNQLPMRYLSIISPKDIKMSSDPNLGKFDFWDSLPINEPQIRAQPFRNLEEL